MVSELNRQLVRRHFSSQADEYDRYARVQARVVDRLVAIAGEVGLAAGLCLEIGSGTGHLSDQLWRRTPQLEPVVSDLAHTMTRRAAQRLNGCPALDADAASLPFQPNSICTVVSSSVYQWVDDLTAAFAEVERVLVPGGVFLFALFGEQSLHELRASHRRALAELEVGRPSHAQQFPSEQAVGRALRGSGLQITQLFSELEEDFHANVPALLRSLKKIGAGNASSQRPPGLASRQVMQRMIDIYHAEFGSVAGIPSTYQVVYGVAGKPVRSALD